MKVADRVQDYVGDLGGPHGEGRVTKMIESQTARIPSGVYLSVGLGAMALSWLVLMAGRRDIANFVGQWVPTLLIVGLYNKLVKLEGSE
jgi:hypothetical protein